MKQTVLFFSSVIFFLTTHVQAINGELLQQCVDYYFVHEITEPEMVADGIYALLIEETKNNLYSRKDDSLALFEFLEKLASDHLRVYLSEEQLDLVPFYARTNNDDATEIIIFDDQATEAILDTYNAVMGLHLEWKSEPNN